MELAGIYHIESLRTENGSIFASIRFNKVHPVFDGHFPGNPIVPGVVQVQILKDLLEKVLKNKVLLNHTKSIKFLNVVSPSISGGVEYEISYEHNQVHELILKCIVKSEKTIHMKYSGKGVLLQEL